MAAREQTIAQCPEETIEDLEVITLSFNPYRLARLRCLAERVPKMLTIGLATSERLRERQADKNEELRALCVQKGPLETVLVARYA